MNRHAPRAAIRAFLAALAIGLSASAAHAEEAQKVAYFGLIFVNTSASETTEAERARLEAMSDALVKGLEESGRYTFVDTAPVAKKADLYANLAHCNGCEASLARELGADLALTGEVQKTSNLILHFSVYFRDAETKQLVGGGSADMRGNTDDTWARAVRYVLKNRILRN